MALTSVKKAPCCSKRSIKLKKVNFAKAKKAADEAVRAHEGKKAVAKKANGKKAPNKPAKGCKMCGGVK